jgi:tetratricopeptide (TPR) repeat protein
VQADPRSPERGQYAFLQDLLKQIAYETLAKADRKAKHLAAPNTSRRQPDKPSRRLVEVVAAITWNAVRGGAGRRRRHGDPAKGCPSSSRSRRSRRVAAATKEAQRYFEKAAAFAEEALWRAELVEGAGRAAQAGGRYPDALALYERAIELYRGEGEAKRVARVTAALGFTMWFFGDIAGGAERMEEAFAALADDEPGAELAELAEALRAPTLLSRRIRARRRARRASVGDRRGPSLSRTFSSRREHEASGRGEPGAPRGGDGAAPACNRAREST